MAYSWRISVVMLALAGVMASCAPAGRTTLLDAGPARQGVMAPGGQAAFVDARAIIILRHADIDPAQKARMGNQTPLLARGEQRAQEVVTALEDAGVTRIVTTSALRTQATAAPLAKELHITPEVPVGHGAEGNGPGSMPKADEARPLYDFLAQTATPAQTILLVEHHSVIPGLMADFGFAHEPAFDDATEFDRAYVILPDAEHHTYHLLRMRYGGDWGAAKK